MALQVQVNGRPLALPEQATVAALLEQMGWRERPVAVEVNGELVARARWSAVELRENDRVEVVTLVGGG